MELPPILARSRRRRLIGLVANGFGQAVAAAALALLIRHGFDGLVAGGAGGGAGAWLWLAVGLLVAAGASAGLRMLERAAAEGLGQDYICQLRLALFDRMSSLAPRSLQARSRGSMMLRFVGDLTALRQWVSLGLARLTVAGISTFGALAALMVVNWMLGLSVGLVLALGLGAGLLLGARLQGRVKEARRRQSYLAANMNDKIASMAVVQVFGQASRERRRVRRQGQQLQRAMVARAWVAGALRALSESTGVIANGTALLLGALEVASGRATPGTVVAAMAIVGLLLPQLRDLGRVYEYYQSARVSRDKVRQFLETPSLVDEHPRARGLRPGPGRIEFSRVSVAGSLKRFSAVAEAGSVVAVVGPNGAGKSTLLALAARLLDPEHGRVRLDGRTTARVRLSSLRREIGMVSPDLPLLRGTVEMNLRYRWPDAPDQEVAEVAALCGVDEVLAELPEGANTRLVDGGLNLSPGQRQRIALARALLGGPRLLLLDEADSSLDPRAAQVLQRVLARYTGTVLMVTHRPDRLASADAIWYLEAGKLIESGSPAELIQRGGPTGQLFGPRLALAS